jgi:hypothetical protein
MWMPAAESFATALNLVSVEAVELQPANAKAATVTAAATLNRSDTFTIFPLIICFFGCRRDVPANNFRHRLSVPKLYSIVIPAFSAASSRTFDANSSPSTRPI